MSNIDPIENGFYYHIYNCGINGEDLFIDDEDYNRFLSLYEKYIDPVAETYAWCLMKNHFHFAVQIKEGIVYRYSQSIGGVSDNQVLKVLDQLPPADFNSLKWQTMKLSETIQDNKKLKTPNSSRHFSHLFSTYTKYINAKYNRHGNLFERPFHRKKLKTDEYLRNVIIYIHNNPIHHGFVKKLMEWQWSSYANYLPPYPTKFQEDIIGNWFNDIDSFKYIHNNWVDNSDMDEYLGL